jgi:hypothetical protein
VGAVNAQELVWPAELNDDGLYRRIFRALIAVGASTDEASDALQEAYEQILRQKHRPIALMVGCSSSHSDVGVDSDCGAVSSRHSRPREPNAWCQPWRASR